MSAQVLIRDWFNFLEDTLHNEAKLAGLLDHGTMIGSAREFFVTRILRSILPPFLHVGTGKVFASNGETSKQIDVVVYDPRFPVFEIQAGFGMYPVEGVIATIEVKSTLSDDELNAAP